MEPWSEDDTTLLFTEWAAPKNFGWIAWGKHSPHQDANTKGTGRASPKPQQADRLQRANGFYKDMPAPATRAACHENACEPSSKHVKQTPVRSSHAAAGEPHASAPAVAKQPVGPVLLTSMRPRRKAPASCKPTRRWFPSSPREGGRETLHTNKVTVLADASMLAPLPNTSGASNFSVHCMAKDNLAAVEPETCAELQGNNSPLKPKAHLPASACLQDSSSTFPKKSITPNSLPSRPKSRSSSSKSLDILEAVGLGVVSEGHPPHFHRSSSTNVVTPSHGSCAPHNLSLHRRPKSSTPVTSSMRVRPDNGVVEPAQSPLRVGITDHRESWDRSSYKNIAMMCNKRLTVAMPVEEKNRLVSQYMTLQATGLQGTAIARQPCGLLNALTRNDDEHIYGHIGRMSSCTSNENDTKAISSSPVRSRRTLSPAGGSRSDATSKFSRSNSEKVLVSRRHEDSASCPANTSFNSLAAPARNRNYVAPYVRNRETGHSFGDAGIPGTEACCTGLPNDDDDGQNRGECSHGHELENMLEPVL